MNALGASFDRFGVVSWMYATRLKTLEGRANKPSLGYRPLSGILPLSGDDGSGLMRYTDVRTALAHR